MRIIFYSDFHWLEDSSTFPAVPPRLHYQMDTAEWIADVIREESPDLVINGGDLKEVHDSIDMTSLDSLLKGENLISATCEELGIRQAVMAGNHDQADDAGKYTILPALQGRSTLDLVKKCRTIDLDGFRVLCVAHRYDLAEIRKTLKRKGKHDLVVVHQDIVSAAWIPGIKDSPVGIDPEELLQYGDYAVGGHFHHPQVLADERFAIIGSPCYNNFKDTPVGIPRGVMMWEDGEFSWLENPHTPIFATAYSLEEAEELLEEFDAANLLLRLKLPDDADAKAFKKVKKKFSNLAYFHVKHDYDIEGEFEAPTSVSIQADHDPVDVVTQHIAGLTTKLSRERLTKEATSVIQESLRQ